MNIPRRTFLKAALTASTAAALGSRAESAAADGDTLDRSAREFYDLRCYRLRKDTRLPADADPALLDGYLERALLPALGRRGLGPVGVFTELDVDRKTATASPQPGSPVWVLIPYPTLESFVRVNAALAADPDVRRAGAAYLDAPKSAPAFERIDSWLLRAFAGMPRIELPAFSRERVPTRVFEMRDYESRSERTALNKIAMFEAGEIPLMRDLGMHPLMYGQALCGPDLPHLRYFTSGPDLATHLAAWSKFGPDPRWIALRDDPQYADNVSKVTSRFLTPRPYSQI